jgi:hypothetical protein
MAEARLEADWDHTSLLACFLYNAFRDPKRSSARGPESFHPLRRARRAGTPLNRDTLHLLRGLVKGGRRGHAARRDQYGRSQSGRDAESADRPDLR